MNRYQPGTRLLVNGQESLLAQVNYGEIAVIELNSGNRWADPVKVDDVENIRISQIVSACDGEKVEVLSRRYVE